MSDSHRNDEYLPFGDIELNEAGDVVGVFLRRHCDDNNYTGENWCRMADTIVRSPALKEIKLDSGYLDEYRSNLNALAAVFGRKRTRPCTLDEFDADYTNLGPEGLAAMLPFLKSTPKIKEFRLREAELGNEGTRLLSEVLNHIRVESLYLNENKISGESLGLLFSAENSKHLHKLDLECNPIGAHGLEAICQFLQRDDTEMRKLYFNYVDQNQFRTVLESLSPRSKMVELFDQNETKIEADLDEESTAAMSQMLKNVVCNTESFEGLCESNHQMIWVGPYTYDFLDSDPMLDKAIEINKVAHKTSINAPTRSKLRAFYFQGQFDVQQFIGMNVVFMPFILELITKKCLIPVKGNIEHVISSEIGEAIAGRENVMEGDLGNIYHLVRNCHLPELFSFPSSESKIRNYESRISSLEEENARLAADNEERRSRLAHLSKKRAKINDN